MCHLFFCCCFFKPSFIDSLHMMWKCSANYHGARKRLNTCYWWGNGVGEAGKKEVMTVFGMSKGKTGPTGNLSWQPPLHHLCGFTGRPPLIGTECQRKDWVANLHVHQMNTCIITFFFANDMNGWGTDNDGMCIIVQRQGLLFQDRPVTSNTKSALLLLKNS